MTFEDVIVFFGTFDVYSFMYKLGWVFDGYTDVYNGVGDVNTELKVTIYIGSTASGSMKLGYWTSGVVWGMII